MQVTFFIFFVISRKLFAVHALKLLSRPIDFELCSTTWVGNLQGIAVHIARIIFSAGRNYISCVKSKRVF